MDENQNHEHTEGRGFLGQISDKLLDLLPQVVYGLIGAVIAGAFLVRDNRHDIADMQLDLASLQQSQAAVVDCVKRPECEAVRATLAGLELRVRATEIAIENHEASARDWKDRIVSTENDVKRLASMHSNRVVPEDIQSLDARVRDLERYKAVDEQQMRGLGGGR